MKGIPRKSVDEIFWQKVFKTEGCWLWTGATNKHGYGFLGRNKQIILAHRFSWMINVGDIPKGMFVLHNCPGGDNPGCVNPKHLWIGNQKDNMHDASNKGRCKGSAKLTLQQVGKIRELYKTGCYSQQELSKRFNISFQTIWNVVHYRSWVKDKIPQ